MFFGINFLNGPVLYLNNKKKDLIVEIGDKLYFFADDKIYDTEDFLILLASIFNEGEFISQNFGNQLKKIIEYCNTPNIKMLEIIEYISLNIDKLSTSQDCHIPENNIFICNKKYFNKKGDIDPLYNQYRIEKIKKRNLKSKIIPLRRHV